MATREIDLVFLGRRVITPDGEVLRCVAVRDGVVVAVEPYEAGLRGATTVELADDEVLLPGLVDTHVHINEPGRTEWEGYATATRAAAAGGVTKLIDMPLNSIPPTCTVDALEIKQKTAAGQCHVDVGFWGGAIPGNIADLRGLHDAGVFGFKRFMTDSGVEEFPAVGPNRRDLGELACVDAMMIVHAEDTATLGQAPSPQGRCYSASSRSTARLGGRRHHAADRCGPAYKGASVHLLHLSSANAVPMIRAARRDGVRMTVENVPA